MSGPVAEPIAIPAYGLISTIGIALLACLAALVWLQPRWNVRLQLAWFDSYQRLAPRKVASLPATVVAIDDESIARLGQWPWPRNLLAELLRAIERERPLAIGVDILMPEPDRASPERLLARAAERDPTLARHLATLTSNDRELAGAIGAGPVVLAIAGTRDRTPNEPLAPPFVVRDRAPQATSTAARLPRFAGAMANLGELDRAASGHGLISAGSSEDVVRRLPLASRIGDRLVPSITIEMLRVALRAPEVRLFADGAAVEAIAVGDFVVPTESDAGLRIYYSRRDGRRFVSAGDVLDGKVDPLAFRQKLVLVGITGLALVDYQSTPLGGRMPGSEIHAQVLENLFDQSWLMRPAWAPPLETAALVLLGLPLVWGTPRWQPRIATLIALGCIALPIVAGVTAFVSSRIVLDAATPALSLLLLFGVLLVLTVSESRRQRTRLEHLVQAQREQAAYVAGELEAAKRIQTGLLPRPEVLRGDPRIELAATMIPAREVGGDLYDFFMLDEHRLFFMVGDVAGKGLSASMFMAVSKALYKSTTLRARTATVGELMRSANEEVSRDNPEMFFVTAFAGVLDLHSGYVAYCNAGHEDPYLVRPRGDLVRLTEGAGPPLCTLEDFAYGSAERHIAPGDVLCVVSDGVIDARTVAGERYGRDRLQALLLRCQAGAPTAQDVVDAVTAAIAAFSAGAEPADDVTVLAWRWVGSPRAS